jgi:thimet oligopeptidase
MLENWCWEATSLALLSGHYITGEPLPKALLEKLVASKNANIGVLTKRQIVFAMFDQRLHALQYSADLTVDTQALAHEVQAKVGPIDPVPGGNFAASFNHLTGGYDATYYGYLYTKAFSDDMFETRFKGRVLDPEVGAAYRRSILQPGTSSPH